MISKPQTQRLRVNELKLWAVEYIGETKLKRRNMNLLYLVHITSIKWTIRMYLSHRQSLRTSSRRAASLRGGFGPALRSPLTALLIFHLFFLQPSGSRTGWLIIEWVLPLNSYLSRTWIQHDIVCAELSTLHSSALFILASSWSHYVYLIQFVNNTYVYVRHKRRNQETSKLNDMLEHLCS